MAERIWLYFVVRTIRYSFPGKKRENANENNVWKQIIWIERQNDKNMTKI